MSDVPVALEGISEVRRHQVVEALVENGKWIGPAHAAWKKE